MIERSARISEASRHIPAGVRAKHAGIPWREVVGIGNVVRHDYDEIDDLVMWTTATEKLVPLRAAVEVMLRDLADWSQSSARRTKRRAQIAPRASIGQMSIRVSPWTTW